jgi:hypothetical protein
VEAFQAIEQFGAVRLLKTSFYAYPLVNALHIAALGVVFASVLLIDLRVFGAFPGLPEPAFTRTFRRIAIGAFAAAAVTGLTLFSVRASEYAAMPVFLAKMVLIAAALANFLGFLAIERSGGHSGALRAMAALSLVLWSGVLICGRFIGFL